MAVANMAQALLLGLFALFLVPAIKHSIASCLSSFSNN